jgi:GNAT superfamily N-acetyltransferase
MDIDPKPFDDPVVQRLVAEIQQEFVTRYGGPDETPLEVATFVPPAGAFFLGTVDQEPIAMGGWRFRPDVQALGRARAAEIKRMYVTPAGRGRGLARAMLAHLERTAVAAGADVMVLETGLKQPEALALYRSSGYVEVEGFGLYKDSPISRYLGKRLRAAAEPGSAAAGSG